MNVPDILGVQVLTPDGRGSIISLHKKSVRVVLNTIWPNRKMVGQKIGFGEMHRHYKYEDVELVKVYISDRLIEFHHFFEVSRLQIGDKALRRKWVEDEFEWREFVVNKTYLELIKQFPFDYKTIQNQ